VTINCAALPEALIESELFGYVEGSFTGTTRNGKAGLYEMAHGGTIFLDEISKLIPVDVRVICASNRDLRKMMGLKQFRSDLYFQNPCIMDFRSQAGGLADGNEIHIGESVSLSD
jgi:transcriptional regulator with PAS, ATPase and Fis domain